MSWDERNKFILTMQEDLTKYSNMLNPSQTMKHKQWLLRCRKFATLFGIPKFILTNQDKDFTSNIIKNFVKLFKTKSTPYHSTNQRGIRKISLNPKGGYLKHHINESQKMIGMNLFCLQCMLTKKKKLHKN